MYLFMKFMYLCMCVYTIAKGEVCAWMVVIVIAMVETFQLTNTFLGRTGSELTVSASKQLRPRM